MATWHQERGGLFGVWQPDPTRWKVVHDRLHQAASVGYFDVRDAAEKHAKATGGVVIPPATYNVEAAQ